MKFLLLLWHQNIEVEVPLPPPQSWIYKTWIFQRAFRSAIYDKKNPSRDKDVSLSPLAQYQQGKKNKKDFCAARFIALNFSNIHLRVVSRWWKILIKMTLQKKKLFCFCSNEFISAKISEFFLRLHLLLHQRRWKRTRKSGKEKKKFSSATKFSMKNRKIRKALEMKFFFCLPEVRWGSLCCLREQKANTWDKKIEMVVREGERRSLCCLTCMFYELLRGTWQIVFSSRAKNITRESI